VLMWCFDGRKEFLNIDVQLLRMKPISMWKFRIQIELRLVVVVI